MRDLILDFMTTPVRTVEVDQTLADVHRIMNGARVRHLPVVEDGVLVGLVSQRDLHLVETLAGVDPLEVGVDEAMTREVLAVTPDTPLAWVVVEMLSRGRGSAVVAVQGQVAGIFTRSDALRVLRVLLEERQKEPVEPRPAPH